MPAMYLIVWQCPNAVLSFRVKFAIRMGFIFLTI